MPTPTGKRRAAIRATMPAAKVAAMTDFNGAENEQGADVETPAAPTMPARPALQLHAAGLSLEPTHMMGPAGPVAMVNVALLCPPVAIATLPMSIDELRTHVDNCRKLIDAVTGEGLYTPPKPELIVATR